MSGPGSPDPPRSTRAQRLARAPRRDKLLVILTVAGFAIPVLAYFAFVARYGVNVLIADQWINVALVGKAFAGHLSLGDLWAQHNEHRILFPNLIALVLGYTTHLNVHIEEYLSALLLTGSIGLIIWTHRLRSPTTPLLWYCPVAILMFSWAQFENTLWGFQIAWYVVLISLAGTLAVLDRRNVTTVSLLAAAVIAVIGSYSSLQGLIIWPAAFLLLLYRRRHWKVLTVWALAALVAVGVYLYHFDTSQLGAARINPFLYPVIAVKLFLFSLGNVAGKPLPTTTLFLPHDHHPVLGSANPWILVFGVVVLVAAVLALAKTGVRHTKESPEALGATLIAFALAFDLSTTVGRGLYGYWSVSASRYTMFNILALVGAYLVLISRHAHSEVQVRTRHSRPAASAWRATASRDLGRARALGVRALPVVVVASLLVAIVFGYANGLADGRQEHAMQAGVAKTLRGFESRHVPIVSQNLLVAPPQYLHIAQRDRLGEFASN